MAEIQPNNRLNRRHHCPGQPEQKASGLTIRRFFTKAGISPYNEVEWEHALAQNHRLEGGIIFEQKDVEVPKDWSMTRPTSSSPNIFSRRVGTAQRKPASASSSPRR